jgi:hypothetical protein
MRTLASWSLLVGFAFLLVTGCGGIHVYRSLGEPNAMKTCNANKSFQVHAPGADEASAKNAAIAKAKETVKSNGGCGLYVVREGYDQKNGEAYTNFQLCECK